MRPTTESHLKNETCNGAGREGPPSGGMAQSGGPSPPSSPGDRNPSLGARVWIEGVIVGRQQNGVNVRLRNGTIQSFSNAAVLAPGIHES